MCVFSILSYLPFSHIHPHFHLSFLSNPCPEFAGMSGLLLLIGDSNFVSLYFGSELGAERRPRSYFTLFGVVLSALSFLLLGRLYREKMIGYPFSII